MNRDAVRRLIVSKPTWKMTETELARVFADHFGYSTSHRSNWIYDAHGRPVICGWGEKLDALRYVAADAIKHGRDVQWG